MFFKIIDSVVGYFLALEILCLEQRFFGRLCHFIASLIFISLVITIFIPRKIKST